MLKLLSLFLINTFIYFEGDVVYNVTLSNGKNVEIIYQIREAGVKMFYLSPSNDLVDTTYYNYNHKDYHVVHTIGGYEKVQYDKDLYQITDSIYENNSLLNRIDKKKYCISKPSYFYGKTMMFKYELSYDNSSSQKLETEHNFNDIVLLDETLPLKIVRTTIEDDKETKKMYFELKSIDINHTPIYFPDFSKIH